MSKNIYEVSLFGGALVREKGEKRKLELSLEGLSRGICTFSRTGTLFASQVQATLRTELSLGRKHG
jgi:hypothetical protein